jgi:hypothetical protein
MTSRIFNTKKGRPSKESHIIAKNMGPLLDFQILHSQCMGVIHHKINLSDMLFSTLSQFFLVFSHYAFLQLEYLRKDLSPTSSLALSASFNAFLDLNLAVLIA